MNWIEAAASLSRQNQDFVIVTILSVEGSSPRNTSTKMVVNHENIYDTIGGGNLEYESIQLARELMRSGKSAVETKTFSLGQDLTQCCGGRVTILFECIPSIKFHIALFGAGHVGKALASILSEIPCRLTWIDSRESVIDEVSKNTQLSGLDFHLMDNPVMEVERCPENCYYLIMTHSHEIDMELVEAVLSRRDFQFCGLIGSRSKSVKFRNRLKRKGFNEEELARLTCPVGMPGMGGKSPMEVAVSVAAQLMQLNQESKNRNEAEPTSIGDNRVSILPAIRE